jgi:hypothetical protein
MGGEGAMLAPMRQAPDEGAPGLLAIFVVGSLTVVGAVVALGRLASDWADAGAVAILIGVLGLLIVAIMRQLGDEDDP